MMLIMHAMMIQSSRANDTIEDVEDISDNEILERCMMALVNASFSVLEEAEGDRRNR